MKVKTFINKLIGAAFIAAILAGCGGDKGVTNSGGHWVAPATEFTVEFDTNGGMPEEIPAVAVDSGATLGTKLPENPTKEGYAFDGWFDEDGVEYTASTIITGDVTLIAAWGEPKTEFIVEFDTDGGTPASIPAVTVDSGATLGTRLPANPTKENYSFVGWFDEDGVEYTASTVIDKDVMLTAAWGEPKTEFIVEFDTDGGTPASIPAVTVDSGATLGTRLPANPTKENYSFVGWFDEDGVEYTASTIITEDVTLIAAWVGAEETYTLTVEADPVDGGVVTPTSPQSGIASETPIEISATAADGYVFVNWELVSGAAVFDDEDDAETTVILSADATIRANFLQVAGTFIDSRDGQTYRWVRIGDQVWMAENLNWAGVNDDLGWCYDGDPENCEFYGRLYNWATAMALPLACNEAACADAIQDKHRGICPVGWYVPTDGEWATLIDFVDSSTAGTQLKATSPHWNGTDDHGFSALPAGRRNADAGIGIGTIGAWWGATEAPRTGEAYFRRMHSDISIVGRHIGDKLNNETLRCIRDDQ